MYVCLWSCLGCDVQWGEKNDGHIHYALSGTYCIPFTFFNNVYQYFHQKKGPTKVTLSLLFEVGSLQASYFLNYFVPRRGEHLLFDNSVKT